MTLWLYGTGFLLGTVIGSFLNVCIYRLPRRESIVFPGSHCPHCGAAVSVRDNIPLIGFLLLRGRCRACGDTISYQYPLVELTNGIGYLLLLMKFGFSPITLLYALFFSSLLVISVIDLHHKIIPNRITLPGMGIGLAASASILPTGLMNGIIGLLLGGVLFSLIVWISPFIFGKEGMGVGDIKLIAMIGATLGWADVLITIMAASFTGSLVGAFLMLFQGKDRKYEIPFGPFLALGALVALFFDSAIIEWYIGGR
jgi:leader peptidase (prepilin peptidase)/N-methyltransferase